MQSLKGGVSSVSTQNLAILLEQLPPTLHNKIYITTTNYSKVLRGLRFPLEITGLHTSIESSGDSS